MKKSSTGRGEFTEIKKRTSWHMKTNNSFEMSKLDMPTYKDSKKGKGYITISQNEIQHFQPLLILHVLRIVTVIFASVP